MRPFGVSLLIAGVDEVAGAQLYQVDPSGSYFAWKATAIGKGMVNAKTFLEKRYSADIETEDAIHTAILTLKEGFEGHMTEKNIELAVVGTAAADRTFRILTPAQLKGMCFCCLPACLCGSGLTAFFAQITLARWNNIGAAFCLLLCDKACVILSHAS